MAKKKGIAIVEFGLILPILFTLILGGTEMSRFISSKKKLHSIGRDVAIEVFKRCQGLSAGSLTQTCVSNQTDQFYARVSAQLPLKHFMQVQIFRASFPFSSTDPCPLDVSYVRQSATAITPTPTTRVSSPAGSPVALLCAGGSSGLFDPSHEAIVSVELHYEYQPLIRFMAQIFGFTTGNVYVATVV